MEHVNVNEILVEIQAGFRKGYSTETTIQFVVEDWRRCLDQDEFVLAVFLDLKRAFETIDRNKLLSKLHQYGIRGTVFKWLNNYLNSRQQKTKINSEISKAKNINIGVPQGSILGPLLFILYINDLPLVLKKSNIQIFADDTLIYVKGKCVADGIKFLNSD